MRWQLVIMVMILALALIGVNIAFVMKLGETHAKEDATNTFEKEKDDSGGALPLPEEKKELTFLDIKTEECMAKDDISARDSCLLALITIADKPELCNKVQGRNDRMRCIQEFAKKTEDYTLCEMLGEEYPTSVRYGQELTSTQLCKDEVAYLIKDAENCWTNNCLYILAQRMKDADLCLRIEDAGIQSDCLKTVV